MSSKRRLLWAIPIVLGFAALLTYLAFRPPEPDTRWNGAYRLDDGRLVVLTPREEDVLRYRMESGDGERTYIGYAPGYLPLPVERLRQQSAAPEALDRAAEEQRRAVRTRAS